VAAESGLRFRHTFGADRLQNILMTTGSGVAMFDYDNDGWLDVFFVNGTHLDKEGRILQDKASHHALFRNHGDGTFTNVTGAAGLGAPSYGQGCACGDFDGDGFTDIYITNHGPNQLYRNRGDGTFEDVTERAGTGDPRWGGGAVFFDYDGDEDLDLFVANYVKFQPGTKGVHSSAFSKRMGFRSFPGPRDYEAEGDVLYRNNGSGTFSDVSEETGLVQGGKGLTVVAADFDGDGDQDLFVANDATPNHFYRNDGGRFKELALAAGLAYDPDGAETAAMGVDVADVDENGLQDLYVTNMVFEFNNLYQNRGNLDFLDTTRSQPRWPSGLLRGQRPRRGRRGRILAEHHLRTAEHAFRRQRRGSFRQRGQPMWRGLPEKAGRPGGGLRRLRQRRRRRHRDRELG
jgi:hypothetical protein